jgi:hypothetical protein
MPLPLIPDLSRAVDTAADSPLVLARFPQPPGQPIVRPALPGVRPGVPGYGPVTPNTVRPNYPRIPYAEQTPAERMQSQLDGQQAMEGAADVEATGGEGEGTVEGPSAYNIERKRRRRRNCCQPDRFLREWLRPGNSIANKRNPALDFTREDFTRVPRNQVFTTRGFNYQYFITGDDMEYNCSGGGTSAWADGQESARCWIVEVKYHFKAQDWLLSEGLDPNLLDRPLDLRSAPRFPGTPPAAQGPRLEAAPAPPAPPGEDRQFRTYGQIINAPDPPAEDCWNIGMRVVTSQRGHWVWTYRNRMLRYNIPGRVEYRAAPGS